MPSFERREGTCSASEEAVWPRHKMLPEGQRFRAHTWAPIWSEHLIHLNECLVTSRKNYLLLTAPSGLLRVHITTCKETLQTWFIIITVTILASTPKIARV